MPTDDETPQSINRAHWDGLAAVHGRSTSGGYYDLPALLAGRNPIQDEVETTLRVAAPNGVSGLEVLHVQSHLAIDSIALGRRGAPVTCADFAPRALAEAARIAELCGVELELVEADSTMLPESLHGRFDLAYATIGVICWIEDLDAWMRSVAACLRPGGALLLVDMHPAVGMTDSLDPPVFDMTYGFAGPVPYDEDGSYADPEAKLPETRGVVFAHSIGETVTAAVDAGLGISYLREDTEGTFDGFGSVIPREADGRYRWRINGGEPLPIYFALVARKQTN